MPFEKITSLLATWVTFEIHFVTTPDYLQWENTSIVHVVRHSHAMRSQDPATSDHIACVVQVSGTSYHQNWGRGGVPTSNEGVNFDFKG
jgi:hypothetical protein